MSIKKDEFQKLKGRRIYQFYLDEETGKITDITDSMDYVKVIRCKDCKWYITNYMKDFPDGFNRMDGLAECQNLLGADDVTEDDYCCKAERCEE